MNATLELTLEETARTLAEAHRKKDPSIERVMLAPDTHGKEIRLVEVSRDAGYTGDIFSCRFKARPDLGVPFPCAIVLVGTDEWNELTIGDLKLPDSWGVEVNELRPI